MANCPTKAYNLDNDDLMAELYEESASELTYSFSRISQPDPVSRQPIQSQNTQNNHKTSFSLDDISDFESFMDHTTNQDTVLSTTDPASSLASNTRVILDLDQVNYNLSEDELLEGFETGNLSLNIPNESSNTDSALKNAILYQQEGSEIDTNKITFVQTACISPNDRIITQPAPSSIVSAPEPNFHETPDSIILTTNSSTINHTQPFATILPIKPQNVMKMTTLFIILLKSYFPIVFPYSYNWEMNQSPFFNQLIANLTQFAPLSKNYNFWMKPLNSSKNHKKVKYILIRTNIRILLQLLVPFYHQIILKTPSARNYLNKLTSVLVYSFSPPEEASKHTISLPFDLLLALFMIYFAFHYSKPLLFHIYTPYRAHAIHIDRVRKEEEASQRALLFALHQKQLAARQDSENEKKDKIDEKSKNIKKSRRSKINNSIDCPIDIPLIPIREPVTTKVPPLVFQNPHKFFTPLLATHALRATRVEYPLPSFLQLFFTAYHHLPQTVLPPDWVFLGTSHTNLHSSNADKDFSIQTLLLLMNQDMYNHNLYNKQQLACNTATTSKTTFNNTEIDFFFNSNAGYLNLPLINPYTSISYKQLYNLLIINPFIPFSLPTQCDIAINNQDLNVIKAHTPSLYQSLLNHFEHIRGHRYYAQIGHVGTDQKMLHYARHCYIAPEHARIDEEYATLSSIWLEHEACMSEGEEQLPHIGFQQQVHMLNHLQTHPNSHYFDLLSSQSNSYFMENIPVNRENRANALVLPYQGHFPLKSYNPWLFDVLNPPININYSIDRLNTLLLLIHNPQMYQHSVVAFERSLTDSTVKKQKDDLHSDDTPYQLYHKYTDYQSFIMSNITYYPSASINTLPILLNNNAHNHHHNHSFPHKQADIIIPFATTIIDEPEFLLSATASHPTAHAALTSSSLFSAFTSHKQIAQSVGDSIQPHVAPAQHNNLPNQKLPSINLQTASTLYDFATDLLIQQTTEYFDNEKIIQTSLHAQQSFSQLTQNSSGSGGANFEESLSDAEYHMIYGDDDTLFELEVLLGLAKASSVTTTTTAPQENNSSSIRIQKKGLTRRQFFQQLTVSTKSTSSILIHLLPKFLYKFILQRIIDLESVAGRMQHILNNVFSAKYNVLKMIYALYSISITISATKCTYLYAILYHITSYIYNIIISKYTHVILVLKWYLIILKLELDNVEINLSDTDNHEIVTRYVKLRDPQTKIFHPPILLLASTHTIDILAQAWNNPENSPLQQQLMAGSPLSQSTVNFMASCAAPFNNTYNSTQLDIEKSHNSQSTSKPANIENNATAHNTTNYDQVNGLTALQQLSYLMLFQVQIIALINISIKRDYDLYSASNNSTTKSKHANSERNLELDMNNESMTVITPISSPAQIHGNMSAVSITSTELSSGSIASSPSTRNTRSQPRSAVISTSLQSVTSKDGSWYIDNNGYLPQLAQLNTFKKNHLQQKLKTASGSYNQSLIYYNLWRNRVDHAHRTAARAMRNALYRTHNHKSSTVLTNMSTITDHDTPQQRIINNIYTQFQPNMNFLHEIQQQLELRKKNKKNDQIGDKNIPLLDVHTFLSQLPSFFGATNATDTRKVGQTTHGYPSLFSIPIHLLKNPKIDNVVFNYKTPHLTYRNNDIIINDTSQSIHTKKVLHFDNIITLLQESYSQAELDRFIGINSQQLDQSKRKSTPFSRRASTTPEQTQNPSSLSQFFALTSFMNGDKDKTATQDYIIPQLSLLSRKQQLIYILRHFTSESVNQREMIRSKAQHLINMSLKQRAKAIGCNPTCTLNKFTSDTDCWCDANFNASSDDDDFLPNKNTCGQSILLHTKFKTQKSKQKLPNFQKKCDQSSSFTNPDPPDDDDDDNDNDNDDDNEDNEYYFTQLYPPWALASSTSTEPYLEQRSTVFQFARDHSLSLRSTETHCDADHHSMSSFLEERQHTKNQSQQIGSNPLSTHNISNQTNINTADVTKGIMSSISSLEQTNKHNPKISRSRQMANTLSTTLSTAPSTSGTNNLQSNPQQSPQSTTGTLTSVSPSTIGTRLNANIITIDDIVQSLDSTARLDRKNVAKHITLESLHDKPEEVGKHEKFPLPSDTEVTIINQGNNSSIETVTRDNFQAFDSLCKDVPTQEDIESMINPYSYQPARQKPKPSVAVAINLEDTFVDVVDTANDDDFAMVFSTQPQKVLINAYQPKNLSDTSITLAHDSHQALPAYSALKVLHLSQPPTDPLFAEEMQRLFVVYNHQPHCDSSRNHHYFPPHHVIEPDLILKQKKLTRPIQQTRSKARSLEMLYGTEKDESPESSDFDDELTENAQKNVKNFHGNDLLFSCDCRYESLYFTLQQACLSLEARKSALREEIDAYYGALLQNGDENAEDYTNYRFYDSDYSDNEDIDQTEENLVDDDFNDENPFTNLNKNAVIVSELPTLSKKRPYRFTAHTIPNYFSQISLIYHNNRNALLKIANASHLSATHTFAKLKQLASPIKIMFPILLNSNIMALLMHLSISITLESYLPPDVYHDLVTFRDINVNFEVLNKFMCNHVHQHTHSSQLQASVMTTDPQYANESDSTILYQHNSAHGNCGDTVQTKQIPATFPDAYSFYNFPLFSTDYNSLSTPHLMLYLLLALYYEHFQSLLASLVISTKRDITHTNTILQQPYGVYDRYNNFLQPPLPQNNPKNQPFHEEKSRAQIYEETVLFSEHTQFTNKLPNSTANEMVTSLFTQFHPENDAIHCTLQRHIAQNSPSTLINANTNKLLVNQHYNSIFSTILPQTSDLTASLTTIMLFIIHFTHYFFSQHDTSQYKQSSLSSGNLLSNAQAYKHSLYDNPFMELFQHFNVIFLPCPNHTMYDTNISNMHSLEPYNPTSPTYTPLLQYTHQIETSSTISTHLSTFLLNIGTPDGILFQSIIDHVKQQLQQTHEVLYTKHCLVFDHVTGLYITQDQIFTAQYPEYSDHMIQLSEYNDNFICIDDFIDNNLLLDFNEESENIMELTKSHLAIMNNGGAGSFIEVDTQNSESQIPDNDDEEFEPRCQNDHDEDSDHFEAPEVYDGPIGLDFNNYSDEDGDILSTQHIPPQLTNTRTAPSTMHSSPATRSTTNPSSSSPHQLVTQTESGSQLYSTLAKLSNMLASPALDVLEISASHAPAPLTNSLPPTPSVLTAIDCTQPLPTNPLELTPSKDDAQYRSKLLLSSYHSYFRHLHQQLYNGVLYKRSTQPHLYRLLSYFHGIMSPNMATNIKLSRTNHLSTLSPDVNSKEYKEHQIDLFLNSRSSCGSTSMYSVLTTKHDQQHQSETTNIFLDLCGDLQSLLTMSPQDKIKSPTTIINYTLIFTEFVNFVKILTAQYNLKDDEKLQFIRQAQRILSYFIVYYQHTPIDALFESDILKKTENPPKQLVSHRSNNTLMIYEHIIVSAAQQSLHNYFIPWSETNQLINFIYNAMVDIEFNNPVMNQPLVCSLYPSGAPTSTTTALSQSKSDSNLLSPSTFSDRTPIQLNRLISKTISHSCLTPQELSTPTPFSPQPSPTVACSQLSDNSTIPLQSNPNNLLYFTYPTTSTLYLTVLRLCPLSKMQFFRLQQLWLRSLSIQQLTQTFGFTSIISNKCFPRGYHQLYAQSVLDIYNYDQNDKNTNTSPSQDSLSLLDIEGGKIRLAGVIKGSTNNQTMPINPYQTVISLLNTISLTQPISHHNHQNAAPLFMNGNLNDHGNDDLYNQFSELQKISSTTNVSSLEEQCLIITIANRLMLSTAQCYYHMNYMQQEEYFNCYQHHAKQNDSIAYITQQHDHPASANNISINKVTTRQKIHTTTKEVLTQFSDAAHLDLVFSGDGDAPIDRTIAPCDNNANNNNLLTLQKSSTYIQPQDKPKIFVPLGADDLLPLFSWIAIHVDIPNIFEMLEMMHAYINTMMDAGFVTSINSETQIAFINFCQAVDAVLNEPFEKYQHYFK